MSLCDLLCRPEPGEGSKAYSWLCSSEWLGKTVGAHTQVRPYYWEWNIDGGTEKILQTMAKATLSEISVYVSAGGQGGNRAVRRSCGNLTDLL